MTRSTNMEHVEVLRHMKETIKAIMQSEVAALDAAIAALSAPQPEGEWVLVPRNPTEAMLDSAESAMIESECAYNAGEHDARSDAHGFPTMRIWQAVVGYRAMLAAAPQPPSAPVGVEGVRHEIQNALRELDAVMTAEGNTSDAVGCAELALQRALEALAQQPAAVDSEMVKRAVNAYDEATGEGWQMPCLQGMRAALTAALTKQPAAVDGDNPYPAPPNRQEAAALAKLALAYLGVTSAHIDAAVARCETDLAAQPGGSDNDR